VEVVEESLTLDIVIVILQALVEQVAVAVDQMMVPCLELVELDLVKDGLQDLTPVDNRNLTVVDMVDLLPAVAVVVVEPQDRTEMYLLKLAQDITVRRQHGALLEEMVVLESLFSDMNYLQTMI
jgi:hypothetical protein|tara:strand:+ start:440 stop:811 length:372 start_codon:yes stop_codon:yes gene_type:complete